MNPVRTLGGSIAGLAHSRFAFLVIGGCATIFLAALALAAGSAVVIIAAGEAYRMAAASVLAVLFGAGAFYAVTQVRATLALKPAAFGASLAELAADREALIERSRDSRSVFAESGDELIRLVNIGMIAYSIGRNLRRSN